MQGTESFEPDSHVDRARGAAAPTALSPLQRLAAATVVAFCALALYSVGTASEGYTSDFSQLWHAACAVLAGLDPYASQDAAWTEGWGFPLLYPLPAVLTVLPLSLLPLRAAEIVFMTGSTGLLAYGVTREGSHRLWIFASGAFLGALAATQWSPLLTASVLLPVLAPFAIVKPNIGGALGMAFPSRPFVAWALGGGAILATAAFLVDPGWIPKWLGNLQSTPHLRPPVLLPGGVLVLLALLRWRRWEARLLVAMACVPHTTLVYETLPLFLVTRGWRQSMAFAALSLAALAGQFYLDIRLPDGSTEDSMLAFTQWTADVGSLSLALIYLPLTILVLRRGNEWSRLPHGATPSDSSTADRVTGAG